MYDGAELARTIAAHPDDIETALAEYEQAMFPRSAEAATEGVRIHEVLYGADAPHSLAGMFSGHA